MEESSIRVVGRFVLHAALWFAWLYVAGRLAGGILAAVLIPFSHLSGDVLYPLALAISALAFVVAGLFGALSEARFTPVRSAPWGPSAVALVVQFAVAALAFRAPIALSAGGRLFVLAPLWGVMTASLFLGETAAGLVRRREGRKNAQRLAARC